MKVEFKYEIDQKVKTFFGDVGIIELAAIDDKNLIKYYVQRSNDSQWFKESQLSPEEKK